MGSYADTGGSPASRDVVFQTLFTVQEPRRGRGDLAHLPTNDHRLPRTSLNIAGRRGTEGRTSRTYVGTPPMLPVDDALSASEAHIYMFPLRPAGRCQRA